MGSEQYAPEPTHITSASESELQPSDAEKAVPAILEDSNDNDRGYIKGRRFWLIFSTFVSSA